MYYSERNAQPDVFENIGDGIWWAIITFATVGYGDIYPITPLGKLLGCIICLVGVAMVAIPTGISLHIVIHAMRKAYCRHPFTTLRMRMCDFLPCGTPAPQETLKTVCAVLIPRKTRLPLILNHQQSFSCDFGRAVRSMSYCGALSGNPYLFPYVCTLCLMYVCVYTPVVTVWI